MGVVEKTQLEQARQASTSLGVSSRVHPGCFCRHSSPAPPHSVELPRGRLGNASPRCPTHTHTLTPQTTAVSSERARHQSGLESRWTTAPFACLKPLDRHETKRKALPHRKCKGQGPQGESLSVKCQRYRLDPLLAALGAWDRNSNSTKSQDGHPSLGTLSFARRRRKMENLYCMATSGGHPARGYLRACPSK